MQAGRFALRHPLLTALALSFGAAISLGLSRFSYALLLPPMRTDLDWSYLLAGAMNTANAFGYIGYMTFIIALLKEQGMQASPALRRCSPSARSSGRPSSAGSRIPLADCSAG